MENVTFSSVAEGEIRAALDKRLKALLFTCFPHEENFKMRRVLNLVPARRFLAEHESTLIGHIAVHRLSIKVGDHEVPFAGVSEVVVHPDFRQKGLAKELLERAHEWLRDEEIEFSLLFGQEVHYASCGYVPLKRSVRYKGEDSRWKDEIHPHALFACLGSAQLPEGDLDLGGPLF